MMILCGVSQVSAIDVGSVPAGRIRSSFLAVACWDDSVVILSLESTDILSQRTTMTLTARAESVCLVEMNAAANPDGQLGSASVNAHNIYLNIGLSTGVLVRLLVDQHSGSLTDFRQRFLGSRPVKLNRISVNNRMGVMALTTKAWLIHNNSASTHQLPSAGTQAGQAGQDSSPASTHYITQHSQLNYESLDCAHTFASEQCPEGIVCVCGNTLRIIVVENVNETFNQQVFRVRYTPRRACKVSLPQQAPLVCVLETDHNEYTEDERARITAANGISNGSSSSSLADGDEEGTSLPVRGPVPPTEGHWASCIRLFNPNSGETVDVADLNNNECAMCVCTCRFISQHHSEETFLVIGTVKDMHLQTRKFTSAALNVYRLLGG
jgi:splicing factor 3B subunit 3